MSALLDSERPILSQSSLLTAISPLYTFLLPLRMNPYTDGRAWARRDGLERHQGVRKGEELTDEEDEPEEP